MHKLAELGGKGVVLSLALIGVTLTAAVRADAGQAAVSVGRITTRMPQRDDVRRELETAIKRELGKVDLKRTRASDRYVLSAALVKMQTVTESDQAEATCVVSATLTREKGGALHAVLQGRARATDAKSAAKNAELEALRAAVRSAIGRVPEAIR